MPYEKKKPIKKEELKKSPSRGGLMQRTLKELEVLGIKLCDVFSLDDVTINLSWSKLIGLINFNADEEVLRWNNTFKEALEIIKIFLV